MAKVAVSQALFRIADRCVQVMGGLGVARDSTVEQMFRETAPFASTTARPKCTSGRWPARSGPTRWRQALRF
jgi:alkylation response protein AidB-like acyl-CoA dehydrogenase